MFASNAQLRILKMFDSPNIRNCSLYICKLIGIILLAHGMKTTFPPKMRPKPDRIVYLT